MHSLTNSQKHEEKQKNLAPTHAPFYIKFSLLQYLRINNSIVQEKDFLGNTPERVAISRCQPLHLLPAYICLVAYTNIYMSCRIATLCCSHAYFSSILVCNSQRIVSSSCHFYEFFSAILVCNGQKSWALHAISTSGATTTASVYI